MRERSCVKKIVVYHCFGFLIRSAARPGQILSRRRPCNNAETVLSISNAAGVPPASDNAKADEHGQSEIQFLTSLTSSAYQGTNRAQDRQSIAITVRLCAPCLLPK